MSTLRFSILLCLFTIFQISCDDNSINNSNVKKGYIIGFDPCTINHKYKIGYLIVTDDLKDTLLTYSLSDDIYRMPASVFLNKSDILYKIPELYFENYRESPFFNDSLKI